MNERIKIFFKKPAVIIAIILFLLPFFWMKPGELNMGGDGGGLYYHDPFGFIKSYILYKIYPFGTGPVEVRSFFLPFVGLLAFMHSIFASSYLVSVVHTGIKLSIGFFAMYLIVKEFLIENKEEVTFVKVKFSIKELIATLTGIFYIFSPVLTKDDRFINPIPSHDQVFLNPLIFYLILKYFTTKKVGFLWGILFVSFIFAHGFSYSAVPALFSFYPLALLFIIIYVILIRKGSIPIRGILLGILFFVLLQFFHLAPQFTQLFDVSSDVNTRIFNTEDRKATVGTFYGILGFASLPASIILPPLTGGVWSYFGFLAPVIILAGFLKNKMKSKLFLLTGLFFLLSLFLVSAKVSYVSVKLYEALFLHVPGFGMFRWFFIQWMFVFIFFYALLFGQALYLITAFLKKAKVGILIGILFVYLVGSSWTFIKGDQFNLAHVQSEGVKRLTIMDPGYNTMLDFIRNLPMDGKIIQFPFSDFNFQVLHGINDGAYVGISTIGQLTGVKDFSGYFHTAPYSDILVKAAKTKDYQLLNQILGLLNIRYIFYNSDPKIYDSTFYGRPFEYVKQYFPATQKEYESFLPPLLGEKIFEIGKYELFLTSEDFYLPHIYIPKQTKVYSYNPQYDKYYHAASSFLDKSLTISSTESRIAYIEKNECGNRQPLKALCDSEIIYNNIPRVYFKKINPVKYVVEVTNIQGPYLLVFSESFHKDWKLFISGNKPQDNTTKEYFNGDISEGKAENIFFNNTTLESLSLKDLPESHHFLVNAYANAWYRDQEDIGSKTEEAFILEMTGQRLLYASFLVSFLSFVVLCVWGTILLKNKLTHA